MRRTRLLSAALKATMPKAAFEEIYAESRTHGFAAGAPRTGGRARRCRSVCRGRANDCGRATGANEAGAGDRVVHGIVEARKKTKPVFWQIDSMAIMPEDIVSMQYGGHSPWLFRRAGKLHKWRAGAYRERECRVDTPSQAAPRSSDIKLDCHLRGRREQIRGA